MGTAVRVYRSHRRAPEYSIKMSAKFQTALDAVQVAAREKT